MNFTFGYVARSMLQSTNINKSLAPWETGESLRLVFASISSRGECATDGRIRYIQTFCAVARDEMKEVPLRCSEYRSNEHNWGTFLPISGSAPGTASDAKRFPKPTW